jgi:hypothetical protein
MRSTGTFNFSANFEPLLKAPLDSRQMVNTFADLIDPSSWKDANGNNWLYNGAIVGVANDPSTTRNGIYLLLDATHYTSAGSWSNASGVSGGAGNGENIGNGDASIFYDLSGSYLRFRTLKAGSGMKIDVSSDIIIFDSSGAGMTYQSTLDPSLSMVTAVGGYPSGTTVNSLLGDSFTEFVDTLLFPTVNPTYVLPTNVFSTNATTLQTVAASISITSTATFSKGSILIGSSFQNYRSGNPINYNYSDPSGNTLIQDVSSASLTNIQTINGYKVLVGYQTFSNNVQYAIGPQPLDNKGMPYGSPLPAGTSSTINVILEGVYPLFATTVSIGTLTQQTLVSMCTANNTQFTMAAESGGNKQTFDIPDAWLGYPTSRPLVGVGTYNTVSGTWDHQGGTQATSLTYWTTSAVTHTISSILTNYTRYTYNGTDRSSAIIRIEF